MLSDQILYDISEAYSPEQILEILELDPLDILQAFRERVQDNINKFEIRPVDCDAIHF
jgi:hypothetical protein